MQNITNEISIGAVVAQYETVTTIALKRASKYFIKE